MSQGRDPAQDLDQNPTLFLETDSMEQDLDQNHTLLLCPEPDQVQDLPGQNQDHGQVQNHNLVQNRKNWVSKPYHH